MLLKELYKVLSEPLSDIQLAQLPEFKKQMRAQLAESFPELTDEDIDDNDMQEIIQVAQLAVRIPELLKDDEFKNNIQKICRGEEDYNLIGFVQALFAQALISANSSDDLTEFVFENPELLNVICCDKSMMGLIELSVKSRPDLIPYMLKDMSIVDVIGNYAFPSGYSGIQMLLLHSNDKKHADLVFSNPDIYGAFDQDIQQSVYNVITDNYRASLPESLLKHSLFAVQRLPKEEHEKLDENLKEKVRNFSKQ